MSRELFQLALIASPRVCFTFSANPAEKEKKYQSLRKASTWIFCLNHSHIFVIFLHNFVSLARNKCELKARKREKKVAWMRKKKVELQMENIRLYFFSEEHEGKKKKQ